MPPLLSIFGHSLHIENKGFKNDSYATKTGKKEVKTPYVSVMPYIKAKPGFIIKKDFGE